MLKGYHILDGYNRLITNWEYQVSVEDFSANAINTQFDKLYKTAEHRNFNLENDLAIVLGDWRKFDPNYDPDAIFKAIEEEGRQCREFKVKFYNS
jgi:hypothetical protein